MEVGGKNVHFQWKTGHISEIVRDRAKVTIKGSCMGPFS